MGSPFKNYLGTEVSKRIKNPPLAQSLRADADERLKAAEVIDSPKFILEQLYEAVRCEVEAILAEKGYKSYSHKATFTFVRTRLEEEENQYIEKLRQLRNKSRYYGEQISQADSDEAEIKIPKIIKKLREKNSQKK